MKKLIALTFTTLVLMNNVSYANTTIAIKANIEDTIVTAVKNNNTIINISKFNISGQDALAKYFILKNSEPDIWYANDTAKVVQQG